MADNKVHEQDMSEIGQSANQRLPPAASLHIQHNRKSRWQSLPQQTTRLLATTSRLLIHLLKPTKPPTSRFSSASAAVNQKESDKDLGDFLNHLTEIEYDLLTVEHTPAVSPSKVTADAPPTKIKRFGAAPSSEELVTRSQFEMPTDTVRRTQRAVKVFSSWAEENNMENKV